MLDVRSLSDHDPIEDAQVAHLTVRVISLLEAMGLLELDEPIRGLRLPQLRGVAAAAAGAGIGRHVPPLLAGRPTYKQVTVAMGQLLEALEESPLPGPETRQLAALFGWPELARLVGASPISLRRYASGAREAPDDVAYRIHWLARVVGDLRGAYNNAGIRRWFERPRPQLGSSAPADLLTGDWSPDEPQVESVRQLAAALVGTGAT